MIPRSQFRWFCGLAVSCGIVASASAYMRKLLEDKLLDQEICRLCIDLLQKDEKCVNTLGPPIQFRRPDMKNTFNNVSNTDASIAVIVSGSKTGGNLLIQASKEETDVDWTLKSLTLEIPRQKISIKV